MRFCQKAKYVCFFLLLWPVLGQAADLGPTRLLASDSILRGRFEEEHYVKASRTPFRSSGRFVVAPAHGLIWIVERPFPMTVVVTPQGMVHSVGGVSLIRVSAAQRPFLGRITALLSAALGGDYEKLSSDFIVRRNHARQGWQAKLTPRNPSPRAMPFRTLSASGNDYVDSAKIIRHDGLADVFTFSDQAFSEEPPTADEVAAFTAVRF